MTTMVEDYGTWTEETLNASPFEWVSHVDEWEVVWDPEETNGEHQA